MVIHFTRGASQETGTGTILDRLLISSPPLHLTSDTLCPRCGDQTRTDGVISKAIGGTCTTASSDPTEDVLQRLLVATNISGGPSRQAASCVAVASVVVSSPLILMTFSFGGLALVGCGMYCVSRYVSDIGVRSDVTKVPVEKITELGNEDGLESR
ncbi:unnamed protein product [Sphenostylis stenocarpa]|uniref:Uncharacterized protein n=1 Tax=Sphenostylis stenocarpa TaxID=92480 RepID=A0AA86SI50_9FABA|nr:unnamed protein product [Sphenostylis stenocarpa]